MYKIIQGDCLETLKGLPDGIAQTCVTSPPYFGLRNYNVEGQIGLEETPEEYVSKLVEVFREVKRILKSDGTLWVVLGDSYSGSGRGNNPNGKRGTNKGTLFEPDNSGFVPNGCKPKDLIGIPWMVAFALRADGWYLRSDIIWAKPNPMPESVTDRCTKAHEYIFMLSKSKSYYYDAEAIKEPSLEYNWESRYERVANGHKSNPNEKQNGIRQRNIVGNISERGVTRTTEGLNLKTQEEKTGPTKNKRDVWTVTTKPYKEAHFATFPPDLIEPCILAGTSERGECKNCGKAWVRVTKRNEIPTTPKWGEQKVLATGGAISGGTDRCTLGSKGWGTTTLGWKPQCDCDFSTVPQIVLDPFGGAGTTALVALKHGRDAILCELNPNYIELTKKRLNEVQPKLNGL